MMFNATFNNISTISESWQSVLLVEENLVPGEIHQSAQITDKLYHLSGIQTHNVSANRYRLLWWLLFDHDHDTPIGIYMYCCSTLRIEMRNTLTWLERFIWPWREIFSLGYVRSFLYLILIRSVWIIYSLYNVLVLSH